MNYKEMQLLTNEKFESLYFKVGDIFSEMLSQKEIRDFKLDLVV